MVTWNSILLYFFKYDIFIKKKGNDKASGNKRFISINRPAKEANHRVLITGATERYVFISCIANSLYLFYWNTCMVRCFL